jgi:acetoin:2,6-dichlorophenolindophenol oxidoreductase subunit beta
VIDLRTLHPLDTDTVVQSVTRTGRLVVADADWAPCGVAGEIVARVAEQALDALRARPVRVTWPDSAVPSSQAIEPLFYPGAREIQAAAVATCEGRAGDRLVVSTEKEFHGPF